MNVCKTGAAITLTSILVGCATPYSEAPIATNFPTSNQQKLQAAAHWNAIAKDVAKQLMASLKEKRPLYVKQNADTTFNRAFLSQLTSALMAEGFVVHKSPAGALEVDVDTQTIQFSPNRPQYRYAGAPSALMAGVWALHSAEANAGAVLLAGAAAADAHAWFRSEFATGDTPQTEIVVTTTVGDDSKYLARSTNVYYVLDSDRSLYEPPKPSQTKNMKVTGQ